MLAELLVALIVSFISVIILGKFLKEFLYKLGLFAIDINKPNKPLLPTSGGLIVLASFFIGVMVFVFEYNFIVKSSVNILLLLTVLISVISISFVGLLDDLLGSSIRFDKKVRNYIKNYTGSSEGIKQWQKVVFSAIAAIPIMAIHFGPPAVSLPFIGTIFFGQIIYTFIVIPLSVIFSSNVFNMLEGLNGIALQMGLVAFIAVLIFAIHTNDINAMIVSSLFISVLAAYLFFGSYPARILPGDSFTYFVGSGFAAVAILTDVKTLALILLIPWIIEFFLKARVKFHAHSWGIIQKDGTLRSPYGNKVYSLTHLFLRTGKFKEWQIVAMLTFIEVIVAVFGLALLW